MQKSDLVQLISRLSLADRRELRKYLSTSLHQSKVPADELYHFIDQRIDKNWAALGKEEAFAHLFPKQPYDDQRMRHLMSFLLKAIEQYLVIQEVTHEEIQEKIVLLKAYRKLKLEKPFRRTLRLIRKKQAQAFIRDSAYYQQRFLVEQEIYLHTEHQKRDQQRNLGQMVEWMDVAYLAQKLRQSCRQLAHEAVYNVAYDQRLLQQLLPLLEDSEWLNYPAISLYFYYQKAVQHPEENHWFAKLKEGIGTHQDQFSDTERKELLQLAINYTIRRFNIGEGTYLRETFDLYRLGLEQELLLESGSLSRFAFKNIAGIAIRLGEYDWTGQFIEQFAEKLPSKHRQTYVDYCLAKLWFEQGQYEEALERLHTVEYDDLFLNLDAKVMLLKIYVELDESEVLDALLTSFKRFIERKKVMGYHRDTYLNTIYFTRKLLELNPYDKQERQALADKVQAAPALAERDWLLGKLV
jgi:hypothetical protein